MTEAEWLAGTDSTLLLAFLEGKASSRKFRLFAVACCRRLLPLAPTKRNQEDVESAERFADGTIPESQLNAVFYQRIERASPIHTTCAMLPDAFHAAIISANQTSRSISLQKPPKGRRDARIGEGTTQTTFLRDIFGNPFRPVNFSPAWLTPTVVSLAEGIYEDRAFDRLPILADALQDAGCEDADVLGHCRGDGVHVRGCWVVDGVLGKV
ncbi:hypothetical protein [Limnoglobus roseus]|uniref:SMI1/KNR4 family protein n=1 Tax=Limnoglobus roseus TaxID=2598579 RepID=A0A5C1AKN0_9BACT|nr:hypothetical protein [Limnoglobus roseus]QEL17428.1 SMI1/KNR4 family protein [Limnoglobus roseus]